MEGITGMIIPLLVFIAIFYFLLIRPQQKRTKETREMQSSLQRGDKIVTIGGLIGTIESIDDQNVVLRSGGSKISFERNAIRSVVKKSSAVHAEKDADSKEKKESSAEKEEK